MWRSVVGQRTTCAENHAPSIQALGLLTSMHLLVDVRLLTRLYGMTSTLNYMYHYRTMSLVIVYDSRIAVAAPYTDLP